MVEPLTRGIGLHGFRAACAEMWGDLGFRAIAARLPDDARAATIDERVLPVSWLPTRFTVDWMEAVWEGPARRDDGALCAFIDRSIELGFGRMRTFFLRLQSVERMTQRAPEMFRYQHSHGTLTAALRGPTSSVVTLRDHPYVRHPVARRATGEVYRHIVVLSGKKDVRETHGLEGPDTLSVRLSWSER